MSRLKVMAPLVRDICEEEVGGKTSKILSFIVTLASVTVYLLQVSIYAKLI